MYTSALLLQPPEYIHGKYSRPQQCKTGPQAISGHLLELCMFFTAGRCKDVHKAWLMNNMRSFTRPHVLDLHPQFPEKFVSAPLAKWPNALSRLLSKRITGLGKEHILYQLHAVSSWLLQTDQLPSIRSDVCHDATARALCMIITLGMLHDNATLRGASSWAKTRPSSSRRASGALVDLPAPLLPNGLC